MPRPTKGTRLYLEPERRGKDGKLYQRATWVIRDGAQKISTGCPAELRELAEQKLAKHIADKYQIPRERGRHPSEIVVSDVLHIYLADVAPKQAREAEVRQRVIKLTEWWGMKSLADVNGRSCREYVAWRTQQPVKAFRADGSRQPVRMVTAAGARRELEDLRAAINYHRREGLCSEIVEVTLPEKSPPRDRWLTRNEVARLLWAAIRYREVQKGVQTDKRSRYHIARFILVAVYTGTRSAAICGAGFSPGEGRGWVDLERGVFYRRPEGSRETKKRQPPIRLPIRLLAHMRRWYEASPTKSAVVEYNGRPLESIRKAFEKVVADAGLGPEVTPHICRHTCATWLMQNGTDVWEAAGYLGMTVEVLESVYGHHHPEFQAKAAEAATAKRPLPARVKGNVIAL